MRELRPNLNSLKDCFCTANYLIFIVALLVTVFSINYRGVEYTPFPIIVCLLMLWVMSFLVEKHFTQISLGSFGKLNLFDYIYIISNLIFILWLQLFFKVLEPEILIFPLIIFAFNFRRRISMGITVSFFLVYWIAVRNYLDPVSYEKLAVNAILAICLVWIIGTFTSEIVTLIYKINESNKNMVRMIRDLPLAVWVLDQNHNIVLSNNMARSLPNDVLTKALEKIEYEINLAAINIPLELDNKQYLVSNTGFLMNQEDEMNILVVNDTTLLRKAEESLQIASRLSLVGEMAAGIAHEIRNPMTTVRGFLQLLTNKAECYSQKEYFAIMIEELDRANAIITEYLSLARSNPEELQYKNLGTIVKTLSPLILANAINTNKNLKVEVGEVPDLRLNEKEIRQLILNLSQNGIDAMESGGTLTIMVKQGIGKVVLSVQDQGKGISQDVLKKIGTPFITTKASGTGLGLATCYNIAGKHNANLLVDTNSSGTIFSVEFPFENNLIISRDEDTEKTNENNETEFLVSIG